MTDVEIRRYAAVSADPGGGNPAGPSWTARGWTTVQLVWRESADTFHVRDPFPAGGVQEDPATGAAAAAFGGYLRELGLVGEDATVRLRQGDDLGRPGRPTVTLVKGEPGVRVSGTAVRITG